MTMNFFKKVMTFFSVIWNAILGRKTDKKAKEVAQSVKEEEQAENDSDPIAENEKLFVDIPLNSPDTNELSEKELFLCDEIPATVAPIVAHESESRSRPGSDFRIKTYSSGVQLFAFEEEKGNSLSFFSEPVRDNAESETPPLSSKGEYGEHDEDESAVTKTDLIQPEAIVEQDPNWENDADKIYDLQESEELPTPPSESISEDGLHGQNGFSELILTAVSTSDKFHGSTSTDTPQVTVINDRVLVTENLTSSSRDHTPLIPKCGINPDLNYLAIHDEMHLFDHDSITDSSLKEIEECKNDRIYQALEPCQIVESEPMSMPKSIIALGTAKGACDDIEIAQNAATSSSEVVPIGVSVSSTKDIADVNEHGLDTSSQYSTNYMVKSDSLVNFLPEGGSGTDVENIDEITDVLLETAIRPMTREEEKEILINNDIPLLKEGNLEEIMCTPRGILKLSGDHHIECTDENDSMVDEPKQTHVKTAVEGFVIDAFAFDEPLLRTHHLEGCILQGIDLECENTEDSAFFRKILKTVETGLEDSVSIQDLDPMTNDESATQPETICQYRPLTQDGTNSPTVSNRSRNDLQIPSPKLSQDENDEDRNSPCRLSQFNTFHWDEDSDCIRQKKNDLASGTATVRYGELLARTGSSHHVPPDRETDSSHLVNEEASQFTKQFTIESKGINNEFLDGPGWRVTLPVLEEAAETRDHESTSLSFLNKHPSPILGVHDENSRRDVTADRSPHTQVGEDMSDFYPFIDCSSYLFRIPEEIRKEASFNPCVGAAPSRRSGYANNADLESSTGFDDEHEGYENKYPNVNALVPNCIGAVPLINPRIPEEYKNTPMAKLPDGYNQTPVSQNVGTFWGTHPGDQQQAVVGYPLSCTEDYYEEEDLNVMSTATYQNGQTNIVTNSEGYGYINPYAAVEFPMLSIPLCTPPSQAAFMPRGPLAPLIFPIGPMNIPQTENLPALMNLEATEQNEPYSIPHTWGGYLASAHLQNDEEDQEIASLVEVRGVAPTEHLSCTGTNDDDDDLDNNPIRDPYFQMADNNSLHTVKSKADSYSGSLFCESLRSLISHNTENENIFPSFSCSSVQGGCPSIVLQSCETTLSNDSLPSIIVEETNYSKSVDEDYLATEKFMNDVNTALNESVLDQIRGRADLHCNLLGRGDGSLPMNPDQSEHEGHVETPENDMILRNSLGENISINNSKLTLLDGVSGTNGGNQPDPVQNLCELDGESLNSAHDYCRDVLDSLVENVLTTLVDQTTYELHIETAETNEDCREILDESHLQANPERDLIVQNMMFIEGVPNQLRQIWSEGLKNKQEIHEQKERIVSMDKVVSTSEVLGDNVAEAWKNFGDVDNTQSFAGDDVPNRRGRRNRRRRKKLSDIAPEVEPEPCAEVTRIGIGDGIVAPQDQLREQNSNEVENGHPSTSKPGKKHSEADTSKPKADGELFANENAEESPKCEQDIAQIEDEGDGQQDEEEEPGENPGNPSNNRRRRNRRRKRKN